MARFDNLIVGGGLAAGMVAQEYRGADGDGSVLLIGREAHPPYHRPPLTKGFLRGEEPVEDTYMHSLDEWQELNVELRLSTEVAAIDPAAHTVELVDGERIEYGRLALATGSTPRTLGEAATIRVIEDSERVGALLNTGSGHLGVIGGGFIGGRSRKGLAWQDLGVCKLVIVDREVHVLPTGVPVAWYAIAKRALARRVEATKPLDVDVHQLSRPGPLIAVEAARPGGAKAASSRGDEHFPDRRGRPTKQPRHDRRPRIGIAASGQNLLLRRSVQPPRLANRHRRAITTTPASRRPIPTPPTIRRSATAPDAAAATAGVIPASINLTTRSRDSIEYRIRRGG